MHRDPNRERDSPASKPGKGLPTWFKLAVLFLVGLIIMKATGFEILVEVTYGGIPFLATLTDAKIYFIPLLLVLIYILSVWIWKKFFGAGDS